MTDIDEKYFSAIQSEAKWNDAAHNKTKETTDDKADDEADDVDSNSMTQGDRDYFNVVKTEDGRSSFFKAQKYLRLMRKYSSEEQEHQISKSNHHFKFHLIPPDDGEPGEKSVIGVYLEENEN